MDEREIIYLILYLVVGVYLVLMSVTDIRKKEIPLVPAGMLFFLVLTIMLICHADPIELIGGMGVGVFIYIVGRLSRGSVGSADAVIYIITGCVLGLWRNLELLLISLVLSAMVGGVLLCLKKATKKTRLAFVPFTLAGYAVVLIGDMAGDIIR